MTPILARVGYKHLLAVSWASSKQHDQVQMQEAAWLSTYALPGAARTLLLQPIIPATPLHLKVIPVASEAGHISYWSMHQSGCAELIGRAATVHGSRGPVFLLTSAVKDIFCFL